LQVVALQLDGAADLFDIDPCQAFDLVKIEVESAFGDAEVFSQWGGKFIECATPRQVEVEAVALFAAPYATGEGCGHALFLSGYGWGGWQSHCISLVCNWQGSIGLAR
jgi:hypothetical protein